MHETGTLNCNQIIRQARDQPMMMASEVGQAGDTVIHASDG